MVEIIRGTTQKHVASKRLADYFEVHNDYSGILYTGYPIIGTSEGPFPIDALWISKEKGLVIFNLVEGKSLDTNYADVQDDSANKLEAKLRAQKTLMKGRKLRVQINVVTFAPAISNLPENESYPICNEENLSQFS